MASRPQRDPYAPPLALPASSDVAGWLFPREPRRLALLFLTALLVCLVGGGALALVMRGELYSPEQDLVAIETYNQIFTLHGLLLGVVLLLPAIPATLGHFAVPRQMGVDRLAVPWLGWASFYLFVVSVGVVVVSTYRAPPFAGGEQPPELMFGLGGLVLSAILTALGLVLTALRRPASGATPVFTWSILLGGVATVVTLLVFGVLAWGRLDLLATVVSAMPGLALLPALGVVCEILEVHARGLAARRFVLVALAVLRW